MTDRKVSPGTSPIASAPEEGQYGLIGGGLVIWVGVMLLLLNSGLLARAIASESAKTESGVF